jgi:hypothetical protein
MAVILGHSQISLTMDTWTHNSTVLQSVSRAAAEQMDAVLSARRDWLSDWLSTRPTFGLTSWVSCFYWRKNGEPLFTSWNQIGQWLRRVDVIRQAA